MRQSVQIPVVVDELSPELPVLGEELEPSDAEPVLPVPLAADPWLRSFFFEPLPLALLELPELLAFEEPDDAAGASPTVPANAVVLAWVAVLVPVVRGSAWPTAIAPKASAPRAAVACTPVLMARRRDGS